MASDDSGPFVSGVQLLHDIVAKKKRLKRGSYVGKYILIILLEIEEY